MPGKFDSETDEVYYRAALDYSDAEYGSVQTCHAWEALVLDVEEDDAPHAHAIVSEDSQGFVDVETFDVAWMAQREWKARVAVHQAGCCAEDNEDD